VVNFSKIEVDLPLPAVDVDNLSTDQKYLYQMCEAINKGAVSSHLANRNPGKISHSRWLTTANRVLRLYVATETPSTQLKIITEYIIKVYAPTWFAIKTKPSCTDGSRHLFALIIKSRYLPDAIKIS